MKYLYILFFIVNLNYLTAKEFKKPHYRFSSLEEIKNAKIYNVWVPMYQEKAPKKLKTHLSDEFILGLKDVYDIADIIGVFRVTDFKISSCRDTESGLIITYKAIVKTLIKGAYKDKEIMFTSDFGNAPYAKRYEQIYILFRNKEGVYYQDFFQYDVDENILKVFKNYKKKINLNLPVFRIDSSNMDLRKSTGDAK